MRQPPQAVRIDRSPPGRQVEEAVPGDVWFTRSAHQTAAIFGSAAPTPSSHRLVTTKPKLIEAKYRVGCGQAVTAEPVEPTASAGASDRCTAVWLVSAAVVFALSGVFIE